MDFLVGAAAETEAAPVLTAGAVTLAALAFLASSSAFLFADSIHNNITLNSTSISREEVINAAKKIGVHKFIKSLPGGYDYDVKERGVMLSSGQRQLIAFLRAYVCNPSILILDEATSSIDSYSEELIQKATETIKWVQLLFYIILNCEHRYVDSLF